ncbi:carboxylesterase family protein [Pedobacter metabolipauper]|uniref:Phospholipase/carboxylesterase n=1 Tax=Pedobacter metabolipauper TaxID=425513 RepID=A0A4R6SWV9_9SPHI|nr:prolyl oligopeptidase family serine peptidase [Pedobacter metabolipauper]TDQ10340.1 phospholipase/carboxylesterase [Pedobacter metabolipauper]
MKTLKLIASITFLFYGIVVNAQDLKKYDSGNYINGKDSIYYRILFPENFDAKQQYPILFFLHGRGESGTDNQKQLNNGGKLFLDPAFRKKFPAIVVFPQCSNQSYWANVQINTQGGKREFNFVKGGKPTPPMHAVLGMIDNFLDKPFIDKKRVYVGGLSMGGMGTYELLRRKPKTFAAAFAICGGDHIANVQKYKKVPLWIFHGEKDDVVPVVFSTKIADQLKVLGKTPKITLYPNANHNSWDSAFAEPELMPWLFAQHN